MITLLSFYLVFIILVSFTISFLVLRLHLPRPKQVIIGLILLILSPLILGYFYITFIGSIPERTVPNLRGMSLEGAVKKLESLNLKGREDGSVFDMSVGEGNVVSQRPEPGRIVKAGRVIKLITSSGRRRVEVPDLLGRPIAQAEAVLSAKGLQLGTQTEEQAKGFGAGIILTQDPLPGQEVDLGTAVNITVTPTVEAEEGGGFKLW